VRRAPERSANVLLRQKPVDANGRYSRIPLYHPLHLTYREHSCDRLDKICQPTKSKRQLKTDGARSLSRVEKTRSDDVSRLERKIDQLVAHIKGPQQNLVSPSSSVESGFFTSPPNVGFAAILMFYRTICTMARMKIADWVYVRL
jgi:hypothetical protein